LTVFSTTISFAQWQPIQQKNGTEKLYQLNQKTLRKQLTKGIATFPDETGALKKYTLTQTFNFDEETRKKYPELKSYIGTNGVDKIYISASKDAVNVSYQSKSIENVSGDIYKMTVPQQSDKVCVELESAVLDKIDIKKKSQNKLSSDDGYFRTIRVAYASNAEYVAYFGGIPQALAAWNTTLTNVNARYYQIGIRFQLVSGSERLLYTNAATDPFGSTIDWNKQLQVLFDKEIGKDNYDIGHGVMKGPAQGHAGFQGSAGKDGMKGSAYSSNPDPKGLMFDNDYVSHENGHQLNMYHTFSYKIGGAYDNEPGSGSTIMGYAGIAGQYNVQSRSDNYFHAKSIELMTNYVKSMSIGTKTKINASLPIVDAGPDYTIPIDTDFELTAKGNENVILYQWDQIDRAFATNTVPETNTTASGVMWRSRPPTQSPKRVFQNDGKWNAQPKKARNLNFRCLVYDGKGQTNSDDVLIKVSGAPFKISTPNGLAILKAGSNEKVIWAKGGSTSANVSISLKHDDKETVLIESTPNDGMETIVVPNLPGAKNRIIIRPTDNIYFTMSEYDFTIESSSNAPILSYTILSPTSVKLTWTQPYNFIQTSFSIYQNPTCDDTSIEGNPCERYLGTTNATSFSYTVKNVKSGDTFVVKGKNKYKVRTEKSNTVVVDIPK